MDEGLRNRIRALGLAEVLKLNETGVLRLLFSEVARSLPLEKMDLGLAVVADKLDTHRRANRGFTPRVIFKSCVEMGLSYACVELVLWRYDVNGPGRRDAQKTRYK